MRLQRCKRILSAVLTAAMVLGSSNIAGAVTTGMAEVKAAEVWQDTNEDKGNFNKDWKFHLGDAAGAETKEFDDSDWGERLLPHDFSMEQEFSAQYEAESGFLPGGTGWYRKSVAFPAEYEGKTLTLKFDGVYNHAYVYVNGIKIGENFYGYNDFSFDLTGKVICDGKTENVIAVKAVNEFPSSRWYSGSGIYRDVTLTVSGDVHVADKGTYVTTPNLEAEQNGDVTVHVETKVKNERTADATVTVRTTVLDASGNVVSKAAVSSETAFKADEEKTVEQEVLVNQPKLWDCDNPNLYYVQTEVADGDKVIDVYKTEFGFRYINYTADEGFWLNGKNVKMKGVCMHHDQGALGAASYYDAVERQVQILKGMGCNAIRSSHNTPSEMLISICNKEGVLVMDEIFDGWTNYKNGNYNDFGKEFNKKLAADNQVRGGNSDMTWSQFVLESNVNRDKNAPSVVIWSIGNELPTGCVGGNNCASTYPGIAGNLISWIQKLDDTKPITMGDNQASWNANDFRTNIDRQLAAAGGVVGLNYAPTNYATKHRQQPTWPLVGTETASPANSRGIYNTLSSYSKFGDYQCTAYDTARVSWGNTARESWYYTIANDCISGEFIWTGFDYIGEPTGTGPWNGTNAGSVVGNDQAVPNSCFFGVIDTAGFPKDSYYYYSSQWMEDRTTLHVVPQSWNEEDLSVTGGMVPVYVYSNAKTVELYLNGEKIGTATRNDYTTAAGYKYATYTNKTDHADICTAVNPSAEWDKMAAQFKVKYAEGTLSVKAYDENGNLIKDTYGLDSVTTNSDKGTSLEVKAEKTEIQADGTSLSYISVDVKDAEGLFVSSARNNIRFSLSGNGTIVGVDNGNPSTTDKYQQPAVLTSEKTANIDAFSGKALVIVRSTEKAGGFTLKAESAGLKGGAVTVDTVGGEAGAAYIKEYSIKTDYTVEMGNAPKLETETDVTMSDGTTAKGTLEWKNVTEDAYNTPGEFVMTGVLRAGEDFVNVEAFLHVLPVFAGFKNYSRATAQGVVPALPETLPGILPNGTEYGAYPVVWDEIKEDALEAIGNVITVKGMITLSEDKQYQVYATVRVAEGEEMTPVNVAPQYKTLTESCGQKADNLLSIVNGVKNNTSSAQERWTNWNDHLQSSSPFITFTWDEAKKIDTVKLWFYTDANVSVPESVAISVAEDGKNFTDVEFDATAFSGNDVTTFTFDAPQTAKAVRLTLTQQGTGYVGLKEAEIWTTAFGYTMNDTAELDTLNTVDGQIVAKAMDNAAVTVLPAADGAKVFVKSENQRTEHRYTADSVPETKAEKSEVKSRASVSVKAADEFEKIPQSVMAADCSATSYKNPVQYNDGGPQFAFDGNAGTAWHTSYVEPSTYAELPQSIEFGLGETRIVSKIVFTAKTKQNNGRIKDMEIFARTGDDEWRSVKTASFTEAAGGSGEVVFDEPVTADRIKVTLKDSYNEIAYKLGCIGEINVYAKSVPEVPEEYEIPVSAVWTDGNDADGGRTEIVVGLKKNGEVEEGRTVTLTKANNWTAAFENMEPGTEDEYEVYCVTEGFDRAEDTEGYLFNCTREDGNGFVVNAVKVIKVQAEVHWLDHNNQSGRRPNVVSLMFKDGTDTKVANIASSSVFGDTVADDLVLPKYKADGTAYDYAVEGASYTDEEWIIENNVEDGVYVVTYRLEEEEQPDDGLYSITVEGGTGSGKYAYNERVVAKAEAEKDGKVFAGWEVNGKVLSTNAEYEFYASCDMTVTAVYDNVPEMEAEAMITNVIVTPNAAAGKYDIKFVAQLVAPEGYRPEEAGLVWSNQGEAYANAETLNLDKEGTAGVKVTRISKISNTWQFSVTVKGVPEGTKVPGRVFARFVDNEGNIVYSEVETGTAK